MTTTPGPPGPRRAIPRRPPRSLIVVVAVGLVAVYCTWWVNYADAHLNPHYTRQPPLVSVEAAHVRWRLLGLTRTDTLTSDTGGDPARPVTGGVWVVAHLEAEQLTADPPYVCGLPQLLGPDGQLWDPQNPPVHRSADCDSDQVAIGRSYAFDLIFEAPDRYVDRVVGIAVEDEESAAPTAVLTPPG